MAVSYNVKVYISDANGNFVDFTDRLGSQGTYRLVELPQITHSAESRAVGGVFTSSINSLTMDNHDGFWDDPDQWQTLKTEKNANTSWNTSTNGREINLQKARLKIVIETLQPDGTLEEDCIGVFYIQDFSTDSESGTCKLEIVSLNHYLKKLDAGKVRDGKKWYESRSIVFLMKELLKLEFADNNDDLPSSFSFPDVLSIPTYNGDRAFSNFGRPPEWDGTSWRNDGLTCRAMVWSYDATIGKGIFMGCDNELWFYEIQSDTYTKIGEVTSGYNIKRLWYSTSYTTQIVGCAWTDPSATSKSCTMKIFISNGINVVQVIDTVSNVYTGEYMYLSGWKTATGGDDPYVIGDLPEGMTGDSDENLLVPFEQNIYLAHPEDGDSLSYAFISNSLQGTTSSDNYLDSITGQTKAGYYAIQKMAFGRDAYDFDLRVSFGGYGFVEFLPDYALEGGIVYAQLENESNMPYNLDFKIYRLSYDDTITIGGMNPYSTISYYSPTETYAFADDVSCLPSCGTVSSDGSYFYVAFNNWDAPNTSKGESYIIKVSNFSTGSTSGTITTTSGYTMVSTGSTFISEMVGRTVKNITTGIYNTIIAYESSSRLKCAVYGADFTAGDSFIIYNTDFDYLYRSSLDTTNVYRTFLDMKYADVSGTDFLYVSYLNRDKLGTGQFGGVATHPLTSQNSLDNIREYANIPIKLVVDGIHKTAYYTLDNGLIFSCTSGGTHSVISGGDQFVESEPNMSSNLCIVPYAQANAVDTDRADRTEDIIFGVSAPFYPNETQENPVIGKYYLWKYDSYLSDRVDLAQFQDMKVWDALTYLSQLALGYVMGFDTDDNGSFFLTHKGNSTYTTTFTVSIDPSEENYISVSKDRGLDEIYNYCKIIPYYSKLSDIKKELYLSPRATDAEEKTVVKVDDIYIDVRAEHSINLKLICVRAGTVNNAYTELEDNALFKYQTYERSIEARSVGDVNSGFTTIKVASTFRGGEAVLDSNNNPNVLEEAINVYDYATFINPSNQEEQVRRITAISDTTLTLESAVNFDVPSGTIFEITHGFDVNGTQTKWSSEGVTRTSASASASTTIYVESARDLSDYTVIKVEDSDTFSRIDADGIGAWNAGNSGYTITLNTAITCSANKKVYAYYSPSLDDSSNYDYFQIGGTGVYIQIVPENTANVNFREGDRITINSEGLILEASDQSAQIAQNITSIDTYGRLEYPNIDNKFLTRNHAKHYCRNLVQDYADPHYILTIERKLYPLLRFVDSNGLVRIRLFDKKRFAKYHEILGYPRKVTHNLRSGKTLIEIRDVEAY